MSKEKAIEKIQYALKQVISVYACSAIFDEKTKVIKADRKHLKKRLSICMMHLKNWRIKYDGDYKR